MIDMGTAWKRAVYATLTAQRTVWFMWVGQGIFAVGGGVLIPYLFAQDAPLEAQIGWGIGGFLSGLATAALVVFAYNCVRSPYRQRDEAREALRVLQEPRPEHSSAAIAIHLSDEARDLLKEASKDKHGTVLATESMGGLSVQTNDHEFAEMGSARSEARWRRAVIELAEGGLLEPRGVSGEVLSVTDLGFKVADHIGG